MYYLSMLRDYFDDKSLRGVKPAGIQLLSNGGDDGQNTHYQHEPSANDGELGAKKLLKARCIFSPICVHFRVKLKIEF
jgi:hypothetical protein